MIIGITGPNGFVGTTLRKRLSSYKTHEVRGLSRTPRSAMDIEIGDIGPDTKWQSALSGIDCIVHLAARTHLIDDAAANPLDEYRRINVQGTRQLALQAASCGVRRFVFVSSIKVNGERTINNPFSETDTPKPEDAYGISKREAEELLREIAAQTGMELIVLRPPLVYGRGVKGNFLRLLKAVDIGLPLPLASIRNHRSLIHVANLADAIIACIDNPNATNNTFLVCDEGAISTPDLIRKLAEGLNRPARLFPCPVSLLMLSAALCGRKTAFARLVGSLTVDDSAIRRKLGWVPGISMDQGLIDTAKWYHQSKIQLRN